MILGIDLGTTNSLIAHLVDGKPAPILNAHGHALTPSCISVDREGTVMVGATARERLLTAPRDTVTSFKRLMGTSKRTRLGGKEYAPEDLSALVLRSLKADAEKALGQAIDEVVISVPAYFNDAQRKATRLAGELAGLTVRRLVNEPTAAALLHGIHERDVESTFLVFDLGGGTFDVSILERFDGVMEVRATGGDTFLGGDDFSAVLATLIGRKAGLDMSRPHERNVLAALGVAAESAKRSLSAGPAREIDLRAVELGTVDVSVEEFERACQPLLERLRAPVERALRDARLRPDELSEIVLVGGATRMPMVRRLVSLLFGRMPARYPDPDETIALGAAICGGLVARDAAFDEVVMTDVCPHTLGTSVIEHDARGDVVEDVYLPIIERNTVIPASRSKMVGTTQDGQRLVRVLIWQGESRQASQNLPLGRLDIPVPPKPKNEVRVDIRYTYDVNGILDVDVEVLGIGITRNLVIHELAGDVSDEEIARRRVELAALRVHPREQEPNRLVLEHADRLYEQLLGAEREQVRALITQFEGALARQDPHEIEPARAAMSASLDSLERGPTW